MNKLSKREQILALLADWIKQRPGLEFGNYGDVSAYRSEMRSITSDRHTAERLLSAVAWRDSITADDLRKAFKDAFSGRLSLVERDDGKMHLDYCTGQYWPTEYRKAACAVLASALWAYTRANVPADVERPGDEIRQSLRREFGRSIQSRWMD